MRGGSSKEVSERICERKKKIAIGVETSCEENKFEKIVAVLRNNGGGRLWRELRTCRRGAAHQEGRRRKWWGGDFTLSV